MHVCIVYLVITYTPDTGVAHQWTVLAAAWSRLTLPLLRTEQCTVHVVT